MGQDKFFQPSIPKKLSNPRPAQTVERDSAFGYKIEVTLNNQTIEFFGPFLEYYDNNFELVTGAIDYALKTMISSKAKNYKKQSGSDTNLSLQEGPLDVRVYEIDFVMSYPLGQGFEMTDIHNIIRAIPDVTTVRTVGETKRTQGNRTVSLQREDRKQETNGSSKFSCRKFARLALLFVFTKLSAPTLFPVISRGLKNSIIILQCVSHPEEQRLPPPSNL
jgi:hypothetical protein